MNRDFKEYNSPAILANVSRLDDERTRRHGPIGVFRSLTACSFRESLDCLPSFDSHMGKLFFVFDAEESTVKAY